MNFSRRRFIQTAAAVPVLSGLGVAASSSAIAQAADRVQAKFRLGMASFSLRNFNRAQAIAMTRRAGLEYICFKDMHLPMNATDEECAAAAEECRRAGLTLYACGVVYMGNAAEVNNAFRYARAAGMNTIIASPNPNLLPLVEERVKETGIYIAIHNHTGGEARYRTPTSIMETIDSLDSRIGMCLDIGNAARVGVDVAKSIRDYKDRIHDLHLKDETEASMQGRNTIFGRGALDMPSYFAALLEIGYDRIASVEYEIEANDPLPGIMESVGYVRGVMRMLTGERI